MNPESTIDRFVGANSFARTAGYVRMNSHLRERHNPFKYLECYSPTAVFRIKTVLRICFFVCGLSASLLANAEVLGRLFFTPEQRTQLEYDQLQNADSGEDRHMLTVNGIVQKHGGARTVWINGVAQPAARSNDRAPESLSVAVPGQVQPVKIKVGQKLFLNPPVSEHPVFPVQ